MDIYAIHNIRWILIELWTEYIPFAFGSKIIFDYREIKNFLPTKLVNAKQFRNRTCTNFPLTACPMEDENHFPIVVGSNRSIEEKADMVLFFLMFNRPLSCNHFFPTFFSQSFSFSSSRVSFLDCENYLFSTVIDFKCLFYYKINSFQKNIHKI